METEKRVGTNHREETLKICRELTRAGREQCKMGKLSELSARWKK